MEAGAVGKKELEAVVEVDVENRAEGRVEGIAETVDNMDVLCGTFAMTTDELIPLLVLVFAILGV